MTVRRAAPFILLLALYGCGGLDEPATRPSPQGLSETEHVVRTVWTAVERGDCDAVKQVVVTPSAVDCAQLGEAAGMFQAEGIVVGEARFEDAESAGDSATVTITWNATLPSETMGVQRVDGEWLAVFDSTP